MSLSPTIRNVSASDIPVIAGIYNHYVRHSIVTFDEEERDEIYWASKIERITKNFPFLVMELDGQVIGYAYATHWKTRKAYQFTCESSIYMDSEVQSKGYGSLLYQALLENLTLRGFKLVLAGISLPNPQSVTFHEKLGFSHHGTLQQVGKKFGQWIDVGYWGARLD